MNTRSTAARFQTGSCKPVRPSLAAAPTRVQSVPSLLCGCHSRYLLIELQDVRLGAHRRDAVWVDLLVRLGVVLKQEVSHNARSAGYKAITILGTGKWSGQELTFLMCSNCVVLPNASWFQYRLRSHLPTCQYRPERAGEGSGTRSTHLCRFGYPDRMSRILHLKCCTYTTSKRTIVCITVASAKFRMISRHDFVGEVPPTVYNLTSPSVKRSPW